MHAFLKLFIRILVTLRNLEHMPVSETGCWRYHETESLPWESSHSSPGYFEDTPSRDSFSSLSPLSQSVPKVKCLGSSLFPPSCVQSQMQTVHLMNILTYGKKKNDKKKLPKESQIDIPFGAGGQLRSQREGDLESCLDFVQKWFHPRLMVLKWSHILNFFFLNPPSKSQEEQIIKG